jgi:hypothetical protein
VYAFILIQADPMKRTIRSFRSGREIASQFKVGVGRPSGALAAQAFCTGTSIHTNSSREKAAIHDSGRDENAQLRSAKSADTGSSGDETTAVRFIRCAGHVGQCRNVGRAESASCLEYSALVRSLKSPFLGLTNADRGKPRRDSVQTWVLTLAGAHRRFVDSEVHRPGCRQYL